MEAHFFTIQAMEAPPVTLFKVPGKNTNNFFRVKAILVYLGLVSVYTGGLGARGAPIYFSKLSPTPTSAG